jgi:hypothetical protein
MRRDSSNFAQNSHRRRQSFVSVQSAARALPDDASRIAQALRSADGAAALQIV